MRSKNDNSYANNKGKQSEWESKWSDPDYTPPWQSNEPPEELKKAIKEGRFKKNQAILDIGCGLGTMSVWLAKHGCNVTGIDFSHSAIERARDTHKDIDTLTFQTVDICGEFTDLGKFDGLFDRGCLHTIPNELKHQYARNISNWAADNAVFLMLFKTPPTESEPLPVLQGRVANRIKNLFDPWFKQKAVRPTYIFNHDNSRKSINWKMPAISIWMQRRTEL